MPLLRFKRKVNDRSNLEVDKTSSFLFKPCVVVLVSEVDVVVVVVVFIIFEINFCSIAMKLIMSQSKKKALGN